MKKYIIYFFSFTILLIITDYFFFYKKIKGYKNDIGFNKNLIVLTGGNHRIKKSLDIFFKINNSERKLFISGVGRGFNKKILENLTKGYKKNLEIIDCCINFEGNSKNTFSNAKESFEWVKSENIDSFILLTNNYHMPRAMLEFKNIFNDFSITPYVFIDKDNSSFNQVINLISEYMKYNLAFVRVNLS